MSQTRYTKDHEWIRVEGQDGTVGITPYAADQLGDVVFVELPEVGKSFKQGDEIAVVESVKAASEIYAPVSGEVVAVNEALEDEPAKVNESPEGEGWFFKIRIKDSSEIEGLMDADAYQNHIE
ncbi:glycine cleavage system protein GcvH [Marinicauda algicola]|uniref:Glycine cleavage system H protein n=1 Tax=Marinicauda algicola TaxID=2029849 RepID=A0A4S2GWJ7_9PROT|nr:glycine cleavage system protein GcvH [Marinicauda algicola]TGY87201.1 glycine cleavage system protein GcvH [Marinicauda algicola]